MRWADENRWMRNLADFLLMMFHLLPVFLDLLLEFVFPEDLRDFSTIFLIYFEQSVSTFIYDVQQG